MHLRGPRAEHHGVGEQVVELGALGIDRNARVQVGKMRVDEELQHPAGL